MAKKVHEKTLMELNRVMWDRIDITLDDELTPEERQEENEQSKLILGFAKQVINNAGVVMQGEKLMAQNKSLDASRIDNLLGR